MKIKKIISTILIATILLLTFSIGQVKAQSVPLDSVTVDTDKTTVNPGDTVKVTVNFGKELGAYTVDVAYDNSLLEYVSAEGGTPSDDSSKVRVAFYDSTGGSAPRSSMSVTFKAKEGIITTNPTDLSITAEGMANADASEQYDDIGVPITKNVVVEPIYEDYDINLTYEGDILVNQEKEMTLKITSELGKNYEHARILAEATTPDGGQVTLKGTDSSDLEHDIIQSGWGDPSGEELGGQNVEKTLSLRALFTKAGAYTIKIKIVDRDSGDSEIASKTFSLTALDEIIDDEQKDDENVVEEDNIVNDSEQNQQVNNVDNENLPQTLPKTGRNVFIPILITIIAISTTIAVLKKKNY